MKTLIQNIKTSIVVTLFFAIILGIIYPISVWIVGKIIFPNQANGSLIINNKGEIIGSKLIGQQFVSSKYFHPRPSLAGTGYDAIASGGSNLGPTSQKLADTIEQRIADYRQENNLDLSAKIPVDAVTASASGLDPEISFENATIQAARVARARNIDVFKVNESIRKNIRKSEFGIFGEAGVNVLLLNMDLDNAYPVK